MGGPELELVPTLGGDDWGPLGSQGAGRCPQPILDTATGKAEPRRDRRLRPSSGAEGKHLLGRAVTDATPRVSVVAVGVFGEQRLGQLLVVHSDTIGLGDAQSYTSGTVEAAISNEGAKELKQWLGGQLSIRQLRPTQVGKMLDLNHTWPSPETAARSRLSEQSTSVRSPGLAPAAGLASTSCKLGHCPGRPTVCQMCPSLDTAAKWVLTSWPATAATAAARKAWLLPAGAATWAKGSNATWCSPMLPCLRAGTAG